MSRTVEAPLPETSCREQICNPRILASRRKHALASDIDLLRRDLLGHFAALVRHEGNALVDIIANEVGATEARDWSAPLRVDMNQAAVLPVCRMC